MQSGFPSLFRRKNIAGEAYITCRKAYIADLLRKSISLWVGHIPMPNPLMGLLFSEVCEPEFEKFQSPKCQRHRRNA